ncbi:MAG TPA: type IV secretion system protein [Methylotenera sp.]|nr:type IV secretion system protein [Methylotenera sp.]HPN02184.1 type IV secretion system protein [Methylotenera sp.]
MANPEFHFVEDTMTKVDAVITTYITTTSQNVMASISSLGTQLMVIYVCFWGWSMLRGIIQEPVTDAVNRFIRMSIILGLSTSLGLYQTYIVDFLWNTPDALASVVAGSPPTGNNGSFLDELFTQQYELGSHFNEKSSTSPGIWPDISMVLAGWLIWLVSAAMIAFGGFLLILSKFALALLLAIGPIFILLVIFEPTKRFFEQWLGQCVNFMLLIVLSAASMQMFFSIIQAYLNAVTGLNGSGSDPQYAQIFPMIFLCSVAILVLLQLPSIASSLAGGVAISTLGFVNAALNKLSGGYRNTKNFVTGQSRSEKRGRARQKESNKRWAEGVKAKKKAKREEMRLESNSNGF